MMTLLHSINMDLLVTSKKDTNAPKFNNVFIFFKTFIIQNGFRSLVLYRLRRHFYINDMKYAYYVTHFFNSFLSRIELSVTADIANGLNLPILNVLL